MKKICIIGGAGHIGLPLALKFSQCKFKVDVIDKNKSVIKNLNKSIFPFYEKGGKTILQNSIKKKKLNFIQIIKKLRKQILLLLLLAHL